MDSERKWWPSELLDESMPAGRASPTDWITGPLPDDPEGRFIVAGWDDEDAEEDAGRQIVGAGEAIGFTWSEDRGAIDILVKEDGSFEIIPGQPDLLEPNRPQGLTEIQADATHFWEPGDIDTMMDTMADFAREYAETEGGTALPMRVTVAMARWEDDIPHRLIVGADGKPRFEPVAKNSVQ